MERRYETKYLALKRQDLRVEKRQLEEAGKAFDRVASEYEELHAAIERDGEFDHQERVMAFLDRTIDLPTSEAFPYEEPSDLAGIRDRRPDGPRRLEGVPEEAELADRLLGAWQGRCSGCLLGIPVEGWEAETLWPFLRASGNYPLSRYVTAAEVEAAGIDRRDPPRRCYVDEITNMKENDDPTFTVGNLAMVRKHGLDFTSDDVAAFWLRYYPIVQVATAERIAYRNFANAVYPPESASRRNPYREAIGAMIRADCYGYVCPGEPERAAELAWRDARVSHVKNGIYAAMWVAAMLAAAPVLEDPREVVEVGLSEVPATSRLAEAVETVLSWREAGRSYDEAVAAIHESWDDAERYDWVAAVSNAQVVATGLLWGEGDYESSVCKAVQAGFDTDSNGSTVGSIAGMLVGAENVPEKWTAPLGDEIETGLSTKFRGEETTVAGYERKAITDLAEETLAVALSTER